MDPNSMVIIFYFREVSENKLKKNDLYFINLNNLQLKNIIIITFYKLKIILIFLNYKFIFIRPKNN